MSWPIVIRGETFNESDFQGYGWTVNLARLMNTAAAAAVDAASGVLKISEADTTAESISASLIGSGPITVTIANPGGNEKLSIGINAATTIAAGSMTAADKTKLDSVSAGAAVSSVAGRTGAVTLAVVDVSGAAPLASPALTGTPTGPTAAADTNTTQLATTAYVVGQGYLKAATAAATYAPLASPTFTGSPALGAATATSINKVAITEPATGATITLFDGSTIATSGAYSITLTATAATTVTLPTTGTLATRAGAETFTNKTLTAPTIDGSLARVTATNTILGDTISAQTISGQVPRVQVSGTNTATSSIGLIRWSASANGTAIYLAKSRSDTPGTQAVAQSGDVIGTIAWSHSDGTNFVRAASIEAAIDGTPGATDMPGRIDFYTTPDGSASSLLAMRIKSDQTTNFSGAILPSADNTHNIGSASFRFKEAFVATGTINTSDQHQKRDIGDLDGAAMLAFVKALRPVSHRWVDREAPAIVETVIERRPVMMRSQVERTVIEVVDGQAVRRIEISETEEAVYDDYLLFDEAGDPVLDDAGNQVVHREPRTEEVQVERVLQPAVSQHHTRTHFGLIAQQVREAMAACGMSDQDFAGWINTEGGVQGLRYHQFLPPLIAAVQLLAARVEALETR